jgi:3-hydroxyisobutyrate dehydrogenase
MPEFQRSLQNIGWIGLGKMGHPMAINLIKAGKKLSVFNRTAKKTMNHESLGGTAINSVKELASSSDVIFTMISDDKAIEEIALADDGIIVNITSDEDANSFTELMAVPPKLSWFIVFLAVRLKTESFLPALIKLIAIGWPILPRPIHPIFCSDL